MTNDLNEIAAYSLCAHLEAQGVRGYQTGTPGDVVLESPPLLLRCNVTPPLPSDSGSMAARSTSVAVAALPLDGREARRSVYTSVAEQANDPREAVVYATHAWCEGVLPPLRRALLSPYVRQGVTGEAANIALTSHDNELVLAFSATSGIVDYAV